MDNSAGRTPVLLTLWQRLGTWLERARPKEGVAAQTFFTVNVVLGTALCFGLRPVLAGCRDWLRWRLEAMRDWSRHRSTQAISRAGRMPKSGSAPAMTAW